MSKVNPKKIRRERDKDLTCFTSSTSCDIGLTGTDNGLVTGMTAQTITFTNGLFNDTEKFKRNYL